MGPFTEMRDRLRSGEFNFTHLDAAQLVKHAFGIVTQAKRKAKKPSLVYIYAEPNELSGRPISESTQTHHREEILQFAEAVAGAEVSFSAISYREWLALLNGEASLHAQRIMTKFNP